MSLRPSPSSSVRVLALALVLGAGTPLLLGCAGSSSLEPATTPLDEAAPRYRAEGPRLPGFTGRDPAGRGWVKVDDLLWIDARDLDAWNRGEVFDGSQHVPRAQALAAGSTAAEGFVLRTDHLVLRTNMAWSAALDLAREADRHCRLLLAQYGESLDLRLPQDPLPIVAYATRREFETSLRALVAEPVDWNAFYDARTGTVYVSAEPAPEGALPLVADVRHEMTHQILDLSRSSTLRGQTFPRGWFWLWEGFAVYTENLGEARATEQGELRLSRLRKRLAWGQVSTIRELTLLPAAGFDGRHYDQSAAVLRFLMLDQYPGAAAATTAVLHDLLQQPKRAPTFEQVYGATPEAVDEAWRRWLGY